MANEQSPARGERTNGSAVKPSSAPEAPPTTVEPAPRPEVTVERLTHQDVNEVCGLYKRVWDAQKGELAADLIKAWEPTPLEFTSWMEGVTYFAARRSGKLTGVVGLEMAHGSGRIVHLAVDPEDRRKGVATVLVHAAVDWARHAGCASVWADALARFTAAAELMRHLGFHESGVLHRHEWNEDVRFFEELL